jgi:hypothetical protein
MLPTERLRWHFKTLRKDINQGRRLSRVQQWLSSLDSPPIIEVIDPKGIWDISEVVWIDRLRNAGHPLLNVQSLVEQPSLPNK